MEVALEQQQRPAGSPPCWGRQYDGSGTSTKSGRECAGCPFNFSCKNAYDEAIGRQMSYQPQGYVPTFNPPQYQPPYQQYPQYPQYQQQWQQPPTPPPVPPPPQRQLPVWQPQQAQPPMWQPQQRAPVPLAPLTQQEQQFQGIFGQYPGETVGERLGKNLILRMLEAFFSELARFFHFYTWPKLASALS